MDVPIVLKSSCTFLPSLALVSMNSASVFLAKVSPVDVWTYMYIILLSTHIIILLTERTYVKYLLLWNMQCHNNYNSHYIIHVQHKKTLIILCKNHCKNIPKCSLLYQNYATTHKVKHTNNYVYELRLKYTLNEHTQVSNWQESTVGPWIHKSHDTTSLKNWKAGKGSHEAWDWGCVVQVLVHVTNILMLVMVHHMSYMGSTHAYTSSVCCVIGHHKDQEWMFFIFM